MQPINQLTFTRFVAAIVIVVYHFAIERETPVFPFNKSETLYEIFKGGHLGVSYFYVLSGFIMYYNYGDETKKINLKTFFVSRIARIYPMHLVALAMMFLIFDYIADRLNVTSFFLQTTLLQAWSYAYRHSYNWPAWSLSVEMFFYLVFPIVLLVIHKLKPNRSIAVLILFWVASMVQQWFFWGTIELLPLLHLNSFLVGILAGILFKNNTFGFLNNRNSNTILFVCTLGVLMFSAAIQETDRSGTGLLAPLFGFFILIVATNKSSWSAFFSKKLFILLGEISYCIYILHWPIWLIMERHMPIHLKNNTHFYFYLGVVILASYFSYEYIEKPSRVFIRKKLA